MQVRVLLGRAHDERSPTVQALLAEALLRLAGVAASASAVSSTFCDFAWAGWPGARPAARGGAGAPDTPGRASGARERLRDRASGAPASSELCRRFDLAEASSPRCWSLWDLASGGLRRGARGEVYLVFDAGRSAPTTSRDTGTRTCLSFSSCRGGGNAGRDGYRGVHIRAGRRPLARPGDGGAHSTAEIDGCDQAELWAAFRCVEPSAGGRSLGLGLAFRFEWRRATGRRVPARAVVAPGAAPARDPCGVPGVRGAPPGLRGPRDGPRRPHGDPACTWRRASPCGPRAPRSPSSTGSGPWRAYRRTEPASWSRARPPPGVWRRTRAGLPEARLSFRNRLEAWWSLSCRELTFFMRLLFLSHYFPPEERARQPRRGGVPGVGAPGTRSTW